MKSLNPIISVVIAGIVLGFLRRVLYFCINLFFKYLDIWVAIILLATLGSWLIFQMVKTAVLTIPIKQFRAQSPLPSYLIALWVVVSSAKTLLMFNPVKYPDISFKLFVLIQALEVIAVIIALFKTNKLVKLNVDIYNFRIR